MVAFHVKRESDFGPVTVNTVIPYTLVVLNIGDVYDTDTDAFTAPANGIYYFYFVHYHKPGFTVLYLRINDANYQEIASDDQMYLSTGTCSAAVQLQQGDTVSTHLYGNDEGNIHCQAGGGECQFGGFLVYEII